MELLGIGDSVIDAYLDEKKMYPGGNAVNVAVLAKRFGAKKAGYIGVLGADEAGSHFLRALEQEGLNVSRVRRVCAPTAQNFIHIDADGDRHFVGNNGENVAQRMVLPVFVREDYTLMEQYAVLHTSVHSFLDASLAAIARRGALSMDFSDGYNARNIERICPLLRFAFFSGGDKTEQEVRALAAYALRCGARTVVVTRGVQGSYLLEKDAEHVQQAVPARVVDALGAGDAYIAAFLVHYTNGGNLAQAAQAASTFAAECCGHAGAFGHAMPME